MDQKALGEIPGRLSAHRGVEREDQAAAARSARRRDLARRFDESRDISADLRLRERLIVILVSQAQAPHAII